MISILKRKIIEGSCRTFLEESMEKYQFYLNNLKRNLELSKRTIELCRSFDFIFDIEYEHEFNIKETIKLVYEIISSINPILGKYFIEKIKDKTIIFRDYEYSYMTDEEGGIKIIIVPNKNIVTTVSLVHEFFHLIHLEKSNLKFKDEEYYCYTESLGMMGEYYALLYLFEKRPDLKNDIKMYINEDLIAMYKRGENTLRDGCLLDVYRNYGDLSKKSIELYVEKNKLSKDYLTMLKYKYDTNFYYGDYIRYINSLPVSLSLGYQLYYDKEFKNNFLNIVSELKNMKFINWKDKYTSKYISNETDMLENANALRIWLHDNFYSDKKEKKLGGL